MTDLVVGYLVVGLIVGVVNRLNEPNRHRYTLTRKERVFEFACCMLLGPTMIGAK